MILRMIASLVICTSFILGSFPVLEKKGDFAPASYDEYELTLADGETLTMRLAGERIIFESGKQDRRYNILLSKSQNMRVVKNFTGAGSSFYIDCASFMDEDVLYNITISYEAYGLELTNGDHVIYKDKNRIHFWKSANYEYNLETCSEMWTDEQSLTECLQPQNDIECDDPVLIAYSERICEGAEDDWEKVFRIYVYIAHQMAYDEVEADDSNGGYQDGAVAVLRDGKSICEGFANAFTALCRAQGIPAVVEFGIGFSDYKEMTERTPDAGDYADHAWAAVYLGGKWHFVDPTYDMSRYYEGSKKVTIVENETSYYLLPLECFSNDHRIYDADTIHGIPTAGYCGATAYFEITRDGVCHIWGYGTIVMPAGVNCFSKVVFEEGSNITRIGKDCFSDCDLLTTVILPETVTYIDDFAFNTCEDLEYVYIPEGVTYIGEQAFDYCDELSYIRVPDSVEKIGRWAFDNCPRLFINVPSGFGNLTNNYDTRPMRVDCRY